MSSRSKLDLGIDILAKDNATATFRKVSKSVSKTEKDLNSFGRSAKLAFAGAGAALAGFAGKGIKDAVALDKSLREVNTLFGLTGKAAEKNFGDISDLVKQVSKDVGVAQETISAGLYSAISAGVPKENALTFMTIASKTAIAGVTDVNTSVNGLTNVLNAFGLKSSETQAVADSMFTAVKTGKTTFKELSDSIFNIAPAAAAAGVSYKEITAGLSTITAAGVPTSVATTNLRAALVGLQRPSSVMDRIFKKLGYTNAQTAIKSKGLAFALDAVKDASKGNNGTLQTLLGSVEAVQAANILAGTGARKFAADLDAQKKSAGATQGAFEEMNRSSAREFEKLKVKLQNVSIELGNKLLPLVTDALDKFSKFAGWVERNRAVIVPLAAVFGTLAASIWAVNTATRAVHAAQLAWATIMPFVTAQTAAQGTAAATAAVANTANARAMMLARTAALAFGVAAVYAAQKWAGAMNASIEAQAAADDSGSAGENLGAAARYAKSHGWMNTAAWKKGGWGKKLGDAMRSGDFAATWRVINAFKASGGARGATAVNNNAGNVVQGKVPQLASGGIVRARAGGTLVNVGEGGRDEAVIPLGRGGGVGTTNVFHIQSLDPAGAARAVRQVLQQMQRDGLAV